MEELDVRQGEGSALTVFPFCCEFYSPVLVTKLHIYIQYTHTHDWHVSLTVCSRDPGKFALDNYLLIN